jgi:hypothetical protein
MIARVGNPSSTRTLERGPFGQRTIESLACVDTRRMPRKISVKLGGLPRGGELIAEVILSTIRPRCIDYSVAKVTLHVDGREISCQTTGLTDASALEHVVQWLVGTFGASTVSMAEVRALRIAA